MPAMLKFEYCKPVLAKTVPTGPDWIHEVKYDGYRGRIVRDGKVVKLLSKSGLDWAWRFPFIVETALKMKQSRFIIDGEICVLDVQGHLRLQRPAFQPAQRRSAALRLRLGRDRRRRPARHAAVRAQGPA